MQSSKSNIANRIKNIWSNVSYLGILESTLDGDKKNIIITNRLSFTIALITFPYIFIFYITGQKIIGLLVIIVVSGYLSVLVFNRFKKVNAGRYMMIMTGNSAVTIYSVFLGLKAGIHIYYIALFCFPFLIFQPREIKKIGLSLSTTLILYILFYLNALNNPPIIIVDAPALEFIAIAIETSTILTIIFALWYLSSINLTMEKLQYALNEAKSITKAKTRFLANISHEIRTPINSISGYSQLLMLEVKKESLPPAILSYINNIQDSTKLLSTLIDNIIDISRAEFGKLNIESEVVRTTDLIKRIKTVMRMEADKKSIALEFFTEEKVPVQFISDRVKVFQIVVNIIGNAIKFSEKKSTITTTFSCPDEGIMQISVKDSGIGMDKSKLEKVFEPFEQIEMGRNRPNEGSGLGLAITRQLTNLLNGYIEVDSKKGEGTVFKIFLPFEKSSDFLTGQTEEYKPLKLKDKNKILIAEDNSLNRKILEVYLKNIGGSVVVAENGEAAVKLAAKEKPDIILMDIHMPIKDGISAAREIKMKRGLSSLPIIALSADTLAETKKEAMDSGITEYHSKPLRFETLDKILEKYLVP